MPEKRTVSVLESTRLLLGPSSMEADQSVKTWKISTKHHPDDWETAPPSAKSAGELLKEWRVTNLRKLILESCWWIIVKMTSQYLSSEYTYHIFWIEFTGHIMAFYVLYLWRMWMKHYFINYFDFLFSEDTWISDARRKPRIFQDCLSSYCRHKFDNRVVLTIKKERKKHLELKSYWDLAFFNLFWVMFDLQVKKKVLKVVSLLIIL